MTALWIALVLAAGSAPHLSAEHPPAPGMWVVLDPEARQLEATAERFAAYWARGELENLTDLLSSQGLVLHLERAGQTPLPRRRALVALRDFMRGYETVGVQILRVVETGGAPPRGFAEIRWIAVPSGTSESLTAALYVGFLQEDGGWRVSEIRVLR